MKSRIAWVVALLFAFQFSFASGHEGHEEEEGKPVDVKELVFGHINDAYSWHIATIGDTHIEIPLLCIVYGQNGLDVFCSSNLGHAGHYTEYKGYKIAEKGHANEGRIIPKWLDFDKNTLTGKVVALADRADIDFPVEETLIVELYSK